MEPRNRYVIRSRISEKKFRDLVWLFAMDLEATKVARLTGLNRNTVNGYFMKLRRRIAEYCERESPFGGIVEVDESYFGPKRVKGRRGRGAGSKTIVFGIFKRNGSVYTEIVPNAKKATLQGIIRGRVDEGTVIHSDGWRGYDGLVDLGYKKHHRVNHGENEFAITGTGVHINGIESFWGTAKTRLMKRRGIRKDLFYLHLKECEFRFNYRHEDTYKKLLNILRKDPLN